MSITCRPARPEDVPETIAIRSQASFALKEKYGYGGKRREEIFAPDSFYAFSLKHELEGFWVAEEHGRLVGMMIAWVRGAFWFLSYLFISPEHQDRKIGRCLLDTALQNGAQKEVTNRALITYAYNTGSIGFYLKHNMFSREPIYKMAGSGSSIRALMKRGPTTEAVSFGDNPESLCVLSDIDREVLGFSRDRHHQYFLQRKDGSGYLFRNDNRVFGYAYIWDDGHVGPLAASSEDAFHDTLESSLILAADKSPGQVAVFVPGSNVSAIVTALQNGLNVSEPYILMATKPFGRWSQYLLHSPPLL